MVKGGFPDHTRVTEASVRWAGGGVFLQVQGERPTQHRHLPRDLAWEKPVPAGWACPGVWRRLPRRRLPRRRLPRLTAPALTEGDTRLVDKQCVSDEPSQRCGLLLCSRGSEKFGFKSEKIV